MTYLNISFQGQGAPSRLVVGTEMKKLMILSENGSEFEIKVDLS